MTEQQRAEQQRIINGGRSFNLGNIWTAYEFVRFVKNADILALQQVVLDKGNGFFAYHFAKDIEGADIEALYKVVLKHGNNKKIRKFERDLFSTTPVKQKSLCLA